MPSEQFIGPAEAASRLGLSPKALRLYEQRGLVQPVRSAAGWRTYGPDQLARLGEVAALRALGLSLAQVERLLRGDGTGLEPVLGTHQATLEAELRRIGTAIETVRAIRDDLAAGRPLPVAELVRLAGRAEAPVARFELPWPWGGERFELREPRAVNWIVGPLGSGKTRFAMRLAEVLPGARFLGLDRAAATAISADAELAARVQAAVDWLVEEGAAASDALIALLAGICADGHATVVVDLVEQGLDPATQEALGALLRGPGIAGRTLFLMTRSSALLDLAAVGPREAIILCPANHSPPTRVLPYPGAPGYERVASCLAPPEVRARTEGVVAIRPGAAA
jgi:DNA-binding transcriptional MerR regulator